MQLLEKMGGSKTRPNLMFNLKKSVFKRGNSIEQSAFKEILFGGEIQRLFGFVSRDVAAISLFSF